MNKKITTLIIGLIISVTTLAQYQNDTITYQKKALWKYEFIHNGQDLGPNDLMNVMGSDLEAMAFLRKAKSNFNSGMGFTIVASLGLGYALYSDLSGGDKIWGIAGIGGGVLILAGIPFFMGYQKNALTAVKIYNSKRKLISSKNNVQLRFGLNTNGLGISLHL